MRLHVHCRIVSTAKTAPSRPNSTVAVVGRYASGSLDCIRGSQLFSRSKLKGQSSEDGNRFASARWHVAALGGAKDAAAKLCQPDVCVPRPTKSRGRGGRMPAVALEYDPTARNMRATRLRFPPELCEPMRKRGRSICPAQPKAAVRTARRGPCGYEIGRALKSMCAGV